MNYFKRIDRNFDFRLNLIPPTPPWRIRRTRRHGSIGCAEPVNPVARDLPLKKGYRACPGV